ncbi:unnamed protein product [Rotaria magnacalcarata]|uniref:Tetraspanin n=2 Tax=Rotaria magnacalcarata TaxID=392030 RepID=A0A816R183_9BILA|nr:unnamed protein product [Rotaria magnacalcarata]CAF2217555.1 unnamed protein product [Rotaria magnacalcarata]CAF4105515.1 unnamed protein product [Rotaria magnacalcarata]
MSKSTLTFASKLFIILLCILGLIELGFALWTLLDQRYKTLAYDLADVGYIDLWILRYLSLCLFVSSIIALVMCLILVWGLYSAPVFLFIASTMICSTVTGEFTISILTFTSKYETRLTLLEQLPKLVITYRQGTDERAKRALDKLQSTFRCCGSDGRLSYQNNVPFSCNMYSIGCLTRTMFFLESWMDALAYILLFFSLIKLFIVLFFFSLLCLYQRNGRDRLKNNRNLINDSSVWRHSLSVDSSSGDNLSKTVLMPTRIINNDEHDNVEKRRLIQNEYDTAATTTSSSSNQRTQNTSTILPPSSAAYNNALAIAYEPYASRKLSSISERTEKSETDESEPDNTRLKNLNSQRKAIITSVYPKQYLPLLSKQLPIVKSRRKHVREDDNDSGVERSSSEKSFDDQQKSHANNSAITNPIVNSKQTNNKSSNLLSLSNVFITSISQNETKDDHVPSTDIIMPKPILKKSSPHSSSDRIIIDFRDQKNLSSIYTNTSSLLYKIPKPIPRSTLKQSKQDESLV